MVGLRGHQPDQLVQFVVGCREDDALAVGADGENDAFAVGVLKAQVPQHRGHLISGGDHVARAGTGQRSVAQVVGRVAPVTDDAFVVAGAAFPVDHRRRFGP